MKRVLVLVMAFTPTWIAAGAVRVTCTIDSAPMQARYRVQGDPSASKAAAMIADTVARLVLPKYLPQWHYVTTSSGDAVIELHISSSSSGKHTLSLILSAAQPTCLSTGTWLEPGELDAMNGYPPLDKLGSIVADAVGQQLFTHDAAQIPTIMSTMKEHVPIVSGGQWLKAVGRQEDPRLVLPLPFADAKILTNSSFSVLCNWPEKQDRAQLQSRALPLPARYVDASRSFDALTLRPLRRIYNDEDRTVREVADEVRQLIPITVFLTSFQEPDVAVATVGGGK